MSMRRPDARALVRKRAASARAREDANGSSPHAASPTRTGRGGAGDETTRNAVQRLEADKSALIYDLQVAQQQIASLTEANRYLERMNSSSGMTSSLRGQLSEARRKLQHAEQGLDEQRRSSDEAIAELRSKLTAKQMEWEIALVTCKEQVLTVTRERDAVLAYATDLERQVKHLKQSQAVRRIAACLTAVRVRTVGGAFAHWCSQINRAIALDIQDRARGVDDQYRNAVQEVDLLKQQNKHNEVTMTNLHQELVDMRGHVSELQAALSSSRAGYTQVSASETALRLRVEQLQEAKNHMESDTRIATERVQGLERELHQRETMLRNREARLIAAEEKLGALTADNQALSVKLKSLNAESLRREENIREALKSLASARSENLELKGELQMLRDSERGIAQQELQLQARLEEVMTREVAVRDAEREVKEQQQSMDEVTQARERVLSARELLLHQADKARKVEATKVADAQRQLGPVQALHDRASAAESMVSVLEADKQDLQNRVEELLQALRNERLRQAVNKQLMDGDAEEGAGEFLTDGMRTKALALREADAAVHVATVQQIEARLREKESRLDRMLTAAEAKKRALEARLAAASTAASSPSLPTQPPPSPESQATSAALRSSAVASLAVDSATPSWAAHMSPQARAAIARHSLKKAGQPAAASKLRTATTVAAEDDSSGLVPASPHVRGGMDAGSSPAQSSSAAGAGQAGGVHRADSFRFGPIPAAGKGSPPTPGIAPSPMRTNSDMSAFAPSLAASRGE